MQAVVPALVHDLVHLLARVLVLLALLQHSYDALERPFKIILMLMNKLLHHANVLLLKRYI